LYFDLTEMIIRINFQLDEAMKGRDKIAKALGLPYQTDSSLKPRPIILHGYRIEPILAEAVGSNVGLSAEVGDGLSIVTSSSSSSEKGE